MTDPYRTAPVFAGRCGRGHMHEAKAIGAWCCVPPCCPSWLGGGFDPERRIERVEVTEGSLWPNAQYGGV